MRCPKCGYISFDHLETCLKCKKSIKTDSDGLHGTVFNVAAPAFLKLADRHDENEENDDVFGDDFIKDTDFVDDDLQVLVEDELTADDMDNQSAVKDDEKSGDSDDSEDREIEMDLSQFEDMDELETEPVEARQAQEHQESQSLSLDLPDELSDMSDLAPPPRGGQAAGTDAKGKPAGKAVPDLNIDDLDFDLGLGDLDNGAPAGAADPAKETILALDDIDFSDTLTKKSSSKPSAKAGGTDMDEDLNFDLDLGGLSIKKKP